MCGGAAAGAVGGLLSGRDIDRSTWMGAVAGAVTWGVGAGFDVAGLGDYVVAQAFVSGAASRATHAALGGENAWQAALIGGSIGAISAYVQANGVAPGRAQTAAGEAKTALDLRALPGEGNPVEFMQVGNVQSQVIRSTIAISKDGILSFNVRVSGLGAGSGFSVRLQTGFLDMNLNGVNNVNFRDWASIPGTVGAGGVAQFGVSVSGITGPAYMRIIPYGLFGQTPPVITNFGPGQGNYIPCNPCDSWLNYKQSY